MESRRTPIFEIGEITKGATGGEDV